LRRHRQARCSGSAAADDGIRDVSNVNRMGKDAVTLVNEMIQGVADVIEWEKQLEKPAKGGAAHGNWSDYTSCSPSS